MNYIEKVTEDLKEDIAKKITDAKLSALSILTVDKVKEEWKNGDWQLIESKVDTDQLSLKLATDKANDITIEVVNNDGEPLIFTDVSVHSKAGSRDEQKVEELTSMFDLVKEKEAKEM